MFQAVEVFALLNKRQFKQILENQRNLGKAILYVTFIFFNVTFKWENLFYDLKSSRNYHISGSLEAMAPYFQENDMYVEGLKPACRPSPW